jgi:hypothetical protein
MGASARGCAAHRASQFGGSTRRSSSSSVRGGEEKKGGKQIQTSRVVATHIEHDFCITFARRLGVILTPNLWLVSKDEKSCERRKFTVSHHDVGRDHACPCLFVITRVRLICPRASPLPRAKAASAVKASAPAFPGTLFMLILSLTVVAYVSSFAAAFVNEFRPAFSTLRNYPPKDA